MVIIIILLVEDILYPFDHSRWVRQPRQARSQQSLQQLLDAAEKQLLANGAEALTLQAVASSAGLTVGAIYRRFDSRDSLLHALHERFAERVAQMLTTLAETAEEQSLSAAEIIRLMARQAWGFARSNQGFMRISHLCARDDARFHEREAELRDFAFQVIRTLLEKRAGEFGHPDPDTAVRFLIEQSMAASLFRFEVAAVSSAMLDEEVFIRELERSCLSYLGVPTGRQA